MRDKLLCALLADEAGEVAVSYAVVAVMASFIAILVFSNLGLSAAELFERITAVIESTG